MRLLWTGVTGRLPRLRAVMSPDVFCSKAMSIRGGGAWAEAMPLLPIIAHGGRVPLPESPTLRESRFPLQTVLTPRQSPASSQPSASPHRVRGRASRRPPVQYHYGGSLLSFHSALSASGHPVE